MTGDIQNPERSPKTSWVRVVLAFVLDMAELFGAIAAGFIFLTASLFFSFASSPNYVTLHRCCLIAMGLSGPAFAMLIRRVARQDRRADAEKERLRKERESNTTLRE